MDRRDDSEPHAQELQDLLPLPHLTFLILLAVAEEPRYGFDIAREVEERSSGLVRPSIGSLYLAIQRLEKQGLIGRCAAPDGEDADSRRRYYRVTELGRRTAEAEARRLAGLLDTAAERHLLEEER